jgi:hypothetical protein
MGQMICWNRCGLCEHAQKQSVHGKPGFDSIQQVMHPECSVLSMNLKCESYSLTSAVFIRNVGVESHMEQAVNAYTTLYSQGRQSISDLSHFKNQRGRSPVTNRPEMVLPSPLVVVNGTSVRVAATASVGTIVSSTGKGSNFLVNCFTKCTFMVLRRPESVVSAAMGAGHA